MKGTLVLVSTPIGNLSDISRRAIETLFGADRIVCEDTRRTGILLSQLRSHQPNHPQLISYYDEVEQKRIPEIIELLESGLTIALITDNGTPTISDPGFRLVREARKRQIAVTAIPGPSAAITALSISGLPTDKYTFVGFLSDKTAQCRKQLEALKQSQSLLQTTIVMYCAPHKLEQTLRTIQEVFGDIELTVARELTKVHEEVITKPISTLISLVPTLKGECVLLFS